MAQTVYLPDGKCTTVFDDNGVLDIVQEYAGKDIRDRIKGIVHERDEMRGNLDMLEDDVEDLKQQADEYNGILHDCAEDVNVWRKVKLGRLEKRLSAQEGDKENG